MEENNVDVSQEVVSPEEASQPVSQEVVETASVQSQEQDAQDKNWREIRQTLKELRRENQYLREQVDRVNASKETPQEEDNEPYLTPERFKKELNNFKQQLKQQDAETVTDRLRSKFSDFDDVVSVENVEYLKQNDPELALSLQALADDPYKQGIAAYKMLKKTDYFLDRQGMQDKKRIAENSAKPTSVQAVRKQGVLGEANRFASGLTPELKKSLWGEMQQARKGA